MSEPGSSSNASKFMIRKWWGRISFSSILIIFGIVMITLFTWVDLFGFTVLLGSHLANCPDGHGSGSSGFISIIDVGVDR